MNEIITNYPILKYKSDKQLPNDNEMEIDEDELLFLPPSITTKPICLDFANIGDERCFVLTGISKNDFLDLYDHIRGFRYNGQMSTINGLGLYLTKLRTGLSIKKLSNIIPIASYNQIKRMFKNIRADLANFVELNLGINANTREDLIKMHTTQQSKTLLGMIFY